MEAEEFTVRLVNGWLRFVNLLVAGIGKGLAMKDTG
jgi:hypothetical protein